MERKLHPVQIPASRKFLSFQFHVSQGRQAGDCFFYKTKSETLDNLCNFSCQLFYGFKWERKFIKSVECSTAYQFLEHSLRRQWDYAEMSEIRVQNFAEEIQSINFCPLLSRAFECFKINWNSHFSAEHQIAADQIDMASKQDSVFSV